MRFCGRSGPRSVEISCNWAEKGGAAGLATNRQMRDKVTSNQSSDELSELALGRRTPWIDVDGHTGSVLIHRNPLLQSGIPISPTDNGDALIVLAASIFRSDLP
jgi:hypothetical protein